MSRAPISDRDRLLVASAAIGVAICSLLWSVVGAAQLVGLQSNYQNSMDQSSAHPFLYRDERDAVAAPVREARDHAQEVMAVAAVVQVLVSVFGLIGVSATAWFAGLAWKAARDQANTAQQALEEASRPILYVSIVGASFFKGPFDPIPTPSIDFQVENVGERFAQIEIMQAELQFGLVPPATEPGSFKRTILCARGLKIDSKGDPFFGQHSSQLDRPTEAELEMIKYGRTAAFFFGIVTYADPLGIVREHGFCFKGIFFASGVAEFYRVTDKQAQYDRRVTKPRIPTTPKREKGKPVPFSEEKLA